MRITLDRDDFVHLIRGGVIRLAPGCQICLEDIGHGDMMNDLKDAELAMHQTLGPRVGQVEHVHGLRPPESTPGRFT